MALSRKFIDSDGVHWQVYELSADGPDDPFSGVSWLYFFARGETRSLTAYPDDWSSMDWRGLEQLCSYARPPARRDAPTRRPRERAEA